MVKLDNNEENMSLDDTDDSDLSPEHTAMLKVLLEPHRPEVHTPMDAGDEYSSDVGMGLSPENSEQLRLASKPGIDHLPAGVGEDGVPVFKPGDKIVAERSVIFRDGPVWLDTNTYTVISINVEKGEVCCTDDQLNRRAYVGFGPRHPHTIIKLAAKNEKIGKRKRMGKGRIAKALRERMEHGDNEGVQQPKVKKGRGRPKGSKNRPKDVVAAEKKQRRDALTAKREARKNRRKPRMS